MVRLKLNSEVAAFFYAGIRGIAAVSNDFRLFRADSSLEYMYSIQMDVSSASLGSFPHRKRQPVSIRAQVFELSDLHFGTGSCGRQARRR